MQPDFDSRGVTRPLSAFLRLAMLGCPARRARGQLACAAPGGSRRRLYHRLPFFGGKKLGSKFILRHTLPALIKPALLRCRPVRDLIY